MPSFISRSDAVSFCLSLENVYEDYPFDDDNWTIMRHRDNKKIFACIFERNDRMWINVKCRPEWGDFLRKVYDSVIPAYHMNKKHWCSIILDGSVPPDEIKSMICESYKLTAPKCRN